MKSKFKRLRKLAQKATPGPWEVGDHPSKVIAPCPCCGPVATCDQYGPSETPDCYNSEYIAAANPRVILELLSELKWLESKGWKKTRR